MARFHDFSEYVEKMFFIPTHEHVWKWVENSDIDGQSAFYYAMEFINDHFPTINVNLAFQIASDIMQEAWDVHLDRIQAEYEEIQSVPNNYDVWEEDDLPW